MSLLQLKMWPISGRHSAPHLLSLSRIEQGVGGPSMYITCWARAPSEFNFSLEWLNITLQQTGQLVLGEVSMSVWSGEDKSFRTAESRTSEDVVTSGQR